MSVIEFQTYIDNGTIELPKEYYDRIKGTRALLFSPTRAGSTPLNRGRDHVVPTCRCLGGRPRRLGGTHGGGGTW